MVISKSLSSSLQVNLLIFGGLLCHMEVHFAVLSIFIFQLDVAHSEVIDRDQKVLPVFQVVRFPNDPCNVSGGTKNGTCYTAEECSNKGGTNGGSCASGFGVCCTFTGGCGSSSAQNCTYFEVTGAVAGPCSHQVCKCASDICQIRLDFDSFVITGPSTNTASIGKQTNGLVIGAGKEVSTSGTCLTDTFGISGNTIMPTVCGTLTGQHVYFDATQECHSLDFAFGVAATAVTAVESNRRFSIKVNQIPCDSQRLAPTGCLQYITGAVAGTKGSISTFNFVNGQHLASQYQTICFRREEGNCRICYSAEADTDVVLGGKADNGKLGGANAASCCGYGADGMKSTAVYDCIKIPGAEKMTASPIALLAEEQCGGAKGLVTAADGTGKTVCSRNQPFRIAFVSDQWELAVAAIIEPVTKGFQLTYFQTTC